MPEGGGGAGGVFDDVADADAPPELESERDPSEPPSSHPLARRIAPRARPRLNRRRMITNRWLLIGHQPGSTQIRTPLRGWESRWESRDEGHPQHRWLNLVRGRVLPQRPGVFKDYLSAAPLTPSATAPSGQSVNGALCACLWQVPPWLLSLRGPAVALLVSHTVPYEPCGRKLVGMPA